MRPALLIVALIIAAPAVAQTPQMVEVHLSNFKFVPSTVTLVHGQSYTLKLINDNGSGHSFGAKDFLAAANVAAQDRAQITNGAIEVPGGETRTVRFIAPAPGSYKVKCTHTLHGAMGMKGQIVVR